MLREAVLRALKRPAGQAANNYIPNICNFLV